MTPTEIKQILSTENIQLTKSLGQNFLHDANQLRRIVAAAGLTKADNVLEIGPGLGPLTELLLASAGSVVAVEKDRRLCELLQTRFKDCSNFELINADALDFLRDRDFSASAAHRLRNFGHWKVVSNLPYSVASPLLVEMALEPAPPDRVVVTLQLEVAERLVASPGTKTYGVLSLLVQLAFVPGEWFKIPPACFFPPPNVDSACIALERRVQPLLSRSEIPLFVQLVKRSFSQRRKMMLKLLKADWPIEVTRDAFLELGLSPQIRGEALALEQFVELTRILAKYRKAT